MKRFFVVSLCTLFFGAAVSAVAQQPSAPADPAEEIRSELTQARELARPIRFGVSSFAQPAVHTPILEATVRRLKDVLGEDRIEVRYYSLLGLQEAVANGEVDFFQSSAGFHVRQQRYGVRAIVTAASNRFPNPNRNEGTAIVTRADRNDIRTLSDARGMRLAANSPIGFSGYQIGKGEVADTGANPDTFFSEEIFTGEGEGMYGVIDAVLDGRADVGFLRLCYLENFPKEAKFLKVLNRKPQEVACVHSTELYPTWTISTTAAASPQAARLVAGALLSMPTTSDGFYWGIANDFKSVHDLFLKLKIGPYEYLREHTVLRFVTRYWPFFALILLAVAALGLHARAVTRLNIRKQIELDEALKKQRDLQEKARETAERIDQMQKIGTIGLLCSTIAHELNQPLAAIVCYARGLRRLAEKGISEKVPGVCEDIAVQADRAFEIVQNVRAYAKGDARREPVNLSEIALQALQSLKASGRAECALFHDIEDGIIIEAVAAEMQLVVINLLRNSSQAVKNAPQGYIKLTLHAGQKDICLTVEDNGVFVNDQLLETIDKPLLTSKYDGLGLGLPIVKSIVQSLGGSIAFARNRHTQDQRGLAVTVLLPKPTERGNKS